MTEIWERARKHGSSRAQRRGGGSAKKHTIRHVHKHAEPVWPNPPPPAGTPVLLPACTAEVAKEDRKYNIGTSLQIYQQRNCVNMSDVLRVSCNRHRTGGGLAINATSSAPWTLTLGQSRSPQMFESTTSKGLCHID